MSHYVGNVLLQKVRVLNGVRGWALHNAVNIEQVAAIVSVYVGDGESGVELGERFSHIDF